MRPVGYRAVLVAGRAGREHCGAGCAYSRGGCTHPRPADELDPDVGSVEDWWRLQGLEQPTCGPGALLQHRATPCPGFRRRGEVPHAD